MGRIVIALLVGTMLVAPVLIPTCAMAHAILVQSNPPTGASIPAGNLDLSLRYNSRIDRVRSRLTLTGPDHRQSVLQTVGSGSPDTLEASVTLTTTGAYVIRWQVLAIDGHITRGDVPFTVTGH